MEESISGIDDMIKETSTSTKENVKSKKITDSKYSDILSHWKILLRIMGMDKSEDSTSCKDKKIFERKS